LMILSGRIQSSTVFGLYFSAQMNSSLIIIYPSVPSLYGFFALISHCKYTET
jgi:hypothetical protein